LVDHFHLVRKSAPTIAVGTGGGARRVRVSLRAPIFEMRSGSISAAIGVPTSASMAARL
jgi:hypothetical protein